MSSSEWFDHLVVGAGMSGMSAAYTLAGEGRTLLLERERSGALHSTGRSAAILSPSYGPAPIRALTRAALPFWQAPPACFAADGLLRRRGVLHVADAARVDRLRAFRRDPDVAAATLEIDGAQARALVPILRAGYVAQALFEADCWDLDVNAIHEGFRRGALARGASMVFGAEICCIERRPRGWLVHSDRGTWQAGTLINAAGAWADPLAAAAGLRPLGIQPKRRTIAIVATPGLDVRAWPMVADIQESLYFKPEAGRLMISPADATDSPPVDAQPDDWDVAVAVERLQHATDLDVRRVERSWAGLRSFAPDGVPAIGFDPADASFFWLAGQGGYGIQIAAAAAQLCADLIAGREPAAALAAAGVDPSQVSPARFAR